MPATDTHTMYKDLIGAGFTKKQAEALVKIKVARSDELMTKSDEESMYKELIESDFTEKQAGALVKYEVAMSKERSEMI